MAAQRNSGNTKGKERFRFYKSKLPAVVWNPVTGKKLADFNKGHFITDDIKVAQTLLDKGYPQIPVDAEAPPNITVAIPGHSLKDGEAVPTQGENTRAQAKPVLVPMTHEE